MADLRFLAETVLVVRRSAARLGSDFNLDIIKLESMGYSYEDVRLVEEVVGEIERFAERRLRSLEQNETDRCT